MRDLVVRRFVAVPLRQPMRIGCGFVLPLWLLSMTATARAETENPAISDEDPPELGESAQPEAEPVGSRVSCLEDASEDGYQRKGVQKRDFLKRGRFELAAVGGFYASDVLSSTYTYGGSAAYFPSEDFGLEALVTHASVEFRLEEPFSAFDGRDRFIPGSAWQVMGALLFSPIHAKFKFTETAIVHGDLFVIAGGGRTFHDTVQGFTWQAGVGIKLYLAKYVTFRFDVRDLIMPQEVLGRGRVTHNLTIFGGLALWLL